jgi:hypothetical protein
MRATMGASQSTRDRTDYVIVRTDVDEAGYVHVRLFVWNLENQVKVRQVMRECDDRADKGITLLRE